MMRSVVEETKGFWSRKVSGVDDVWLPADRLFSGSSDVHPFSCPSAPAHGQANRLQKEKRRMQLCRTYEMTKK